MGRSTLVINLIEVDLEESTGKVVEQTWNQFLNIGIDQIKRESTKLKLNWN
jgi:hypothetical protein